MNPIQVILAMESPMLRGILKDLIQQESDLEVAAEACDPVDLLLAVAETQADVVIHSWPASQEIPGICTHLLLEYPDLLLIGIPPNADHAVACRQTIATKQFPTAGFGDLLSEVRSALVGT